MSKPTLTVTEDRTKELMDTIKSFRNDKVLIGIPQEDNSREADDEQPIGNAALMFINEFGSPANNIPARPAMSIGIKNAQDLIAAEYKKALQQAWTKGNRSLVTYYSRIGMIAANSVKRVFNSQEGLAPPAESTLKSRKSRGFNGTKSLIVTGQLRNAITYVVKEG